MRDEITKSADVRWKNPKTGFAQKVTDRAGQTDNDHVIGRTFHVALSEVRFRKTHASPDSRTRGVYQTAAG